MPTEKGSEKESSGDKANLSEKTSGKVDDSRRSILKTSIAAIVAGVVAGVGGYLAGQGVAPPEKTVTETVEKTAPAVTVEPTPKVMGPDVIRVGSTNSYTGYMAAGCGSVKGAYEYWAGKLNSEGGIYLHKYDKRVPIKLITYDDRSEVATCVKLYEKLITDDKVDLVLGPLATYLHFPLVPVTDKLRMPLVCGISDSPLKEEDCGNYAFFPMGTSDNWIAWEPVEFILAHPEAGYETVAVINPQEVSPTQIKGFLEDKLKKAGFDIVYYTNYPVGIEDLTGVATEIKTVNPDAFLAITYPEDCFAITKALIAVDFNPKFLWYFAGATFPAFASLYEEQLEGISTYGQWTRGLPGSMYPDGEGMFQYLLANYPEVCPFGTEVDAVNSPLAMCNCQITQQAVEAVGKIDHEEITAYIRNRAHKTMSSTIDSGGTGRNKLRVSVMCQWQNKKLVPVQGPDARNDYWQPYHPAILEKPAWKKG